MGRKNKHSNCVSTCFEKNWKKNWPLNSECGPNHNCCGSCGPHGCRCFCGVTCHGPLCCCPPDYKYFTCHPEPQYPYTQSDYDGAAGGMNQSSCGCERGRVGVTGLGLTSRFKTRPLRWDCNTSGTVIRVPEVRKDYRKRKAFCDARVDKSTQYCLSGIPRQTFGNAKSEELRTRIEGGNRWQDNMTTNVTPSESNMRPPYDKYGSESSGHSSSKSPGHSSSKSPKHSSKKSSKNSSSKSPKNSRSNSPRHSNSTHRRSRSTASNRSSKRHKKPNHRKAKSSSPASSSPKSSLRSSQDYESQQSLPFIPSKYPADPEPEDYFNDFSANFNEPPPPPPLVDESVDHSYPPPAIIPPAPYPFGDDDIYPPDQSSEILSTVIDPSQLPSIYPNNYYESYSGGICGGTCMCTCWWKARSIISCKCMEIPLYPRPKQTGGGYGFINKVIPKRSNTRAGANGEGDHLNVGEGKIIFGLCSRCAAEEAETSCKKICWGGDFAFRSNSGNGKTRLYRGSTNKNATSCDHFGKNKDNLCNCFTTTEYKAAYTNPENQHHIKKRHKTGRSLKEQRERDQVYLMKFRELMKRPPWNFDTRVPTPPFDESLGGIETKLQNLDEMVYTETRTPYRSRSRMNRKPYKSKSKPRRNGARSRSRAQRTKRPTATTSPSRAATRSPQRGRATSNKRAPKSRKNTPSPKSKPKPYVGTTTTDDGDDSGSDSDEEDSGEGGSGSYTSDT